MKVDVINEFKKMGGVLTLSQIMKKGITRYELNKKLSIGTIEKIERGIYALSDIFIDEFYLFQLKYKNAIFSNNTAMYFFNKTERTPSKMDVTLPYEYNTTSIENIVNIHKVSKEILNLGVVKLKSPQGQIVKAYNLERTVCDIIKDRKYIDLETANKSIKLAIRDKQFNSNLMFEYAKKMKIYDKVEIYMEAII